MSIEILAFRHMPDLYRREIKNVGVIAYNRTTGEVGSRFLGQDADGRITSTAGLNRAPLDVYQRWIAHYLSRITDERNVDLETLHLSRPVNFFLEPISTLLEDEPLDGVVARAFGALVTEPKSAQGQHAPDRLREAVEAAFKAVAIRPEPEPTFVVSVETDEVPVAFAYAYTNGQKHLMDLLRTGGRRSAEAVRKDAFDFSFRTELATQNGVARSFIAFADLSEGSAGEASLRLVEQRAHLLDVSDSRFVGNLANLLTHS